MIKESRVHIDMGGLMEGASSPKCANPIEADQSTPLRSVIQPKEQLEPFLKMKPIHWDPGGKNQLGPGIYVSDAKRTMMVLDCQIRRNSSQILL